MNDILIPPCSYQGGKQRLAKQIVDIFYEENNIDDNTKFLDVCCGSGAITLELINRGIHPNNITMIDSGGFGLFWNSIANAEFDLKEFKKEIDNLPSIENIQDYLKNLSKQKINYDRIQYDFLLLQAGSFGSKAIVANGEYWTNSTFRNLWQPTETSNRRSHVNPMMPMPNTLYDRVENIVVELSGCINVINTDVFQCLYAFDELENRNAIVYIDPPYKNTSKYDIGFDIYELLLAIWSDVPIYVSEGFEMEQNKNSYLLSKGRKKGNISGNINKKPIEEWLNKY